jgi:hypothetical protein
MGYKFYIILIFKRLYWSLIPLIWKFFKLERGKERSNFIYTIGIVTYVDRYSLFFKPLIKNLVKIFSDTEFIIAVNGYYDQGIQKKYLTEIKAYLSSFTNVKIVDFMEPQSLSKLWNLIIINSTSAKVLIFNDDILISPTFRRHLERSDVLKSDIGIINSSWSHFIISNKIVLKIGWFDERFPAVGNEDQDYECRLVMNDLLLSDHKIKGLKNVVFLTKNFSYGKKVDVEEKKYVKQNKIFFDSKWNLSKVPISGYKYVRIMDQYVQLKPEMDTPNFYNEINSFTC